MVQRLHHTITDGEGGIRISVQFLDLERHPAVVPEGPHHAEVVSEVTEAVAAVEEQVGHAGPGPSESWLPRTAGALGHVVKRSAGQAAQAGRSVGNLVVHPDRLPSKGADLVAVTRSAMRQLTMDGRHSPLWTERSLDRWFGTSMLLLDDVKRAAHQMGGSVNDLFVAGAVAAASSTHERAGMPVESLRVSIP